MTQAVVRRRSPRLDLAEWVLLLDLFMAAGRRTLPASDPRLQALSATMRSRRAGQGFDPAWRSANGLRREMSVLRTLDIGMSGSGKCAAAAEDAWHRFAHDDAARAAEVSRIVAAGAGRPQVTNPDWTEDETLLALDTYLRIRPRRASKTDPLVVELSGLLYLNARRTGVRGAPSFRNPAGVARKIDKFRAAEAGERSAAVKGAQLEAEVWRRFVAAPGETLLAAASVRAMLLHLPPTLPVPDERRGVPPSRGPVPAFGPLAQIREDGETCVYLMVLVGPVERLYPRSGPGDEEVVKIGRSTDAIRRALQLNVGFPPGSGLAWRPAAVQRFKSADEAHRFEQSLLEDLYRRGLTLGGEFARLPRSELQTLLPAKAASFVSPRPRSTPRSAPRGARRPLRVPEA